MPFTEPIDFREALQALEVKTALPTTLGSAQLADLRAAIRERALFSARVAQAEKLQQLGDLITGILQPKRVERTDPTTGETRLVTEGLDRATARLQMKDYLDSVSYAAAPDEQGTIKDLRSDQRINLQLDMNTQMAQGYGYWAQGQDAVVLDEFPAIELYRAEDRKEKRNWTQRWRAAGGGVFTGLAPNGYPIEEGADGEKRLIALKDSGVAEAASRFGLPYGPPDFNSGMDWRDVDRATAQAFGLIAPDETVEPQTRGFNEDLEMSTEVRDARFLDVLAADLPEGFRLAEGVLTAN